MRSRYPIRLLIISLAGVLTLVPARLPAQKMFSSGHHVPDKVGAWRPFVDDYWTSQNSREVREKYRLTAAQVQALAEKLVRISNVFRAAKSLNPPMGFVVEPWRYVGEAQFGDPPGGPVPLHLHLRLREYLLWCETCEPKPIGEPSHYINVWVNSIGAALRERQLNREDEQGPIFYAPWDDGEVAGYPRFDNGVIIVTNIKRPLWVPVSQERYIRMDIRDRTAEFQQLRRVWAEGSPYEQFLKGHEKRLREIEEAYQGSKKYVDPKLAEEYRAQAIESEDYALEELKKSESEWRADVERRTNHYEQAIHALEAELASLSPADRAAPAHYDTNSRRRPSRLVDPGTPGVQRIVGPNKDFFDPQRPLATQLIVVGNLHHTLREVEAIIRNDFLLPVPQSRADEANGLFLILLHPRVQGELDWKRLASLLD